MISSNKCFLSWILLVVIITCIFHFPCCVHAQAIETLKREKGGFEYLTMKKDPLIMEGKKGKKDDGDIDDYDDNEFPKGKKCKTYEFLGFNFLFVDEHPKDLPEGTVCNDFLEGQERCPGTQQTLSAQFIDQTDKDTDGDNEGIYNIIDVFTTDTNKNQFVRIGHGSFTIPSSASSLFVQTFQKCVGSSDNCQTFLGITGGTGIFACASGHVDFEGTNGADEILYIPHVCGGCGDAEEF